VCTYKVHYTGTLLLSPLLATCPSRLMKILETTLYRDMHKWYNDKTVMILGFHIGFFYVDPHFWVLA
jgi:hypothetical protein